MSCACIFFALDSLCSVCSLTDHTQKVFPKQGTTSFLATVVFPKDHPEKTAAVLSRLNQAVGKQGNGAIIEGIHAEVSSQ